VACFKKLPQHFPGVTEKNDEKYLNQASRSPSQNSNQGPLEFMVQRVKMNLN